MKTQKYEVVEIKKNSGDNVMNDNLKIISTHKSFLLASKKVDLLNNKSSNGVYNHKNFIYDCRKVLNNKPYEVYNQIYQINGDINITRKINQKKQGKLKKEIINFIFLQLENNSKKFIENKLIINKNNLRQKIENMEKNTVKNLFNSFIDKLYFEYGVKTISNVITLNSFTPFIYDIDLDYLYPIFNAKLQEILSTTSYKFELLRNGNLKKLTYFSDNNNTGFIKIEYINKDSKIYRSTIKFND